MSNWFDTLKGHFNGLQLAMDINIKTIPRVFCYFLALHEYFKLQKEKIPGFSHALALDFEKQIKHATVYHSQIFNEKKATDIRSTLTLIFE